MCVCLSDGSGVGMSVYGSTGASGCQSFCMCVGRVVYSLKSLLECENE